MDSADVYAAALRQAVPRVLSMLDREPLSKTFGCADRVFWCWKFTDFPGARFQEIAYLLAELALKPALLEQPPQQETLVAWAKAAIAYWRTLQHGDGSFDEAYPYERSLAAVAFTGFYVGQAFLKLRHAYSQEESAAVVETFRMAGDWLCRNDEKHGVLSNHLAAAAAALATIYDITGEARYAARRDYFVGRILAKQSEEGWYEEYGGADVGYQTHTTFYLGKVWQQTKDVALLESLARSVRYFWHFVHVDGSLGGEYGSRNTRFYMPAGFEILAGEIPEAAAVAVAMRAAVARQSVVGLQSMDAYNVLPFINNYAATFGSAAELAAPPALPSAQLGVKRFQASGHVVISMLTYQAVIATGKGGVVQAIAKRVGENAFSDAGVALKFVNGAKASSQGLSCSEVRSFEESGVCLEARFTAINQVLMSPSRFMVFRLLSLVAIVCPPFAYALKKVLVQLLVRRKKPCAARLLREIRWDEKGISVRDEIVLNGASKVARGIIGGRFSAVHMGSSRYFEWQELAHRVMPEELSQAQVEELNASGKLVVNRRWDV